MATIESSSAAIWQRAEALYAGGDQTEARPLYESLLADPQACPWAELRLSMLEARAGALRRETEHALRASQAAHGDPRLLAMLAQRLFEVGEARAALASAVALLQLPGAAGDSLAQAAKLLSDHMEPALALRLLDRAVAVGFPRTPAVAYLSGLNRMYLGQMEQATIDLQRSLEQDPDFAPSYWSLAKLRVEDGRSARIDRLTALLRRLPPDHPDVALLAYSLFHELDARDDTEAAWPVLLTAMAARARQVDADDDGLSRLHEATLASLPGLARAQVGADGPGAGPHPLFVVGMPRTGTTVIERALCRAADVASVGELPDLVQQARWTANRAGGPDPDAALVEAITGHGLAQLGRRYLEHTRWRARHAPFYADKWPGNWMLLGPALAAIPDARAVAVVRDPMDACFSNLKEWFGSSHRYSYGMADTARQYARYRRQLDAVARLFEGRIHVVRYEAFVAAPTEQVAATTNALRLPLRSGDAPAPGATIATASTVQARAPVSTRNVGAWRRYERQLAPLRAALRDAGIEEED